MTLPRKTPINPPEPPPVDSPEYRLWLNAIVSLEEGGALRSSTPESLIREHHAREKSGEEGILVRRSSRLWGIRRSTALQLPADTPAPQAAPTTTPQTTQQARARNEHHAND
jgi:hypothetical protein